MRFYGLKSCDSCRKARKQLAEAGMDFDYVDVRADGIPDAERTAMIAALGDKLVNKSSTTWRGLSEVERDADTAALLAEHPTLMKRPVIEKGGTWTVGWNKDVQAQHLGG